MSSLFLVMRPCNQHFSKYPLSSHNAVTGDLTRINWSNFARDSHVDADIATVEALYRAMAKFEDLLYDSANTLSHKMAPGEMVTVINTRLGACTYSTCQKFLLQYNRIWDR